MISNPNSKAIIKGYTLMEILLVIAILGILSGIAVPYYLNAKYQAKVALGISEISVIMKAIYIYHSNHDEFPDTLDQLGLRDITDPWGRPYRYLNFKNTQGKGMMRKNRFMVPVNSDFDLYSVGRDGKTATPFTAQSSQDDIVFANDGGYIGLVSNY